MAQQGIGNDRRRWLLAGACLLVGMGLASCSRESPAYVIDPDRAQATETVDRAETAVRVRNGDSLSMIAERCDVSTDALIRWNELGQSNRIYPGQILRVPSESCEEWSDIPRPVPRPRHVILASYEVPRAYPRPRPDYYDDEDRRPQRSDHDDHQSDSWWSSWWNEGNDSAADSSARFIWPVHGSVIGAFGHGRHGEGNDGINIATEDGAPIRAAASGVVTYTGNELRGYGNLVLIKHKDGFVTAYAHAGSIRVSRGDRVEKGQVIATVGETGDVDRPQLHFEIRKGVQAVDPERYLSGRAS